MSKTRHQKGYVYKKGKAWFVRFYDNSMQEDGFVERVQMARKIAPVCDQYRSKKAVMPLVEELLKPVNTGTCIPEGTMTLAQFLGNIYLRHVAEQRRPSTAKGYKHIWRRYLEARCGSIRLREFRTCDGERLLAEIARQNSLSRNTLKHLKSLLRGVFKHAKRLGALSGVNPMQDVSVPKGRETGDTYAYSLEAVLQMLMVLPEPAATVVAAAAFTGMRRGELRGLTWADYDGSQIRVTRSVWEGHVSEPKTRQSKAPIPVIGPLAKKLESWRLARGSPADGPIFASGNGTPLNLSNLARRVIRPALQNTNLKWHGWHGFRRGLATNLYRLGVADKTIQAILRHANLSTTMDVYVKSLAPETVEAMRWLEQICTSMHPNEPRAEAHVM